MAGKKMGSHRKRMAETEFKFELSQEERDSLQQIHNAQAIRELTEQPGWPLIQHISQLVLGRMEEAHLGAAARLSRDAYWVQGAELAGARKYARLLTETIAYNRSLLDEKLIPPTRSIELAELDGELNVP